MSDGTKDLSISALTCAGTATLNGHVNLGNSSADDLTVTASLASDLPVKTTGTYNIGGASTGLLSIYLAASADADTARIVAAAHAADRTYTIPDAGTDATFVMSTTSLSGTYSPTLTAVTNVAASTTAVCNYTRVGSLVHVTGVILIDPTATGAVQLGVSLPIASDFTLTTDCSGVVAAQQADTVGYVIGDATNNRAAFEINAGSASNGTYGFVFMYQIK